MKFNWITFDWNGREEIGSIGNTLLIDIGLETFDVWICLCQLQNIDWENLNWFLRVWQLKRNSFMTRDKCRLVRFVWWISNRMITLERHLVFIAIIGIVLTVGVRIRWTVLTAELSWILMRDSVRRTANLFEMNWGDDWPSNPHWFYLSGCTIMMIYNCLMSKLWLRECEI